MDLLGGEASSAPTMTGEFVEGMVSAAKFLKSIVVGSDIENLDGHKGYIKYASVRESRRYICNGNGNVRLIFKNK